MKTLPHIAFFLGLAALCTTTSAGKIDTKKPVKVFVLAGQSNMRGHGRNSAGSYCLVGGASAGAMIEILNR